MQIGVMAKHLARPTLAETLAAVRSYGISSIQFNFECVGLPTLPDEIAPELASQIGEELAAQGVSMAAVSGTFNMIHPDAAQRADGLRRLRVLAAACSALGTSVITLCTGTRDPDHIWRRHPDNDTPEAWRDLLAAMEQAVASAAEYGVTLAIEPEVANVVDSAVKARRLLDAIDSPHLKVVIDGANLFHAGELPRMAAILDEAFALLGDDIVLAHAKDLDHDGEAGHLPAGTGLLDYDHYLRLLKTCGYDGALILHSLEERQIPASVAFLRTRLAALG